MCRLAVFILFHLHTDERESIEMNAAACINSKCNEPIQLTDTTKLPFKCSRCEHVITEKHYQTFRDVMNTTRMHLDKMKMSNFACMFRRREYSTVSFHLPIWSHSIFHRFGHLQRIDTQTDRSSASNECPSIENIRLGFRKCHRRWQIGWSVAIRQRAHSRLPVNIPTLFCRLSISHADDCLLLSTGNTTANSIRCSVCCIWKWAKFSCSKDSRKRLCTIWTRPAMYSKWRMAKNTICTKSNWCRCWFKLLANVIAEIVIDLPLFLLISLFIVKSIDAIQICWSDRTESVVWFN